MGFNEIKLLLSKPEVRKLLVSYAGENTIAVINALEKESEDEKVAEKLNVRVSDVRAVLNKLAQAGFANYERVKDEESGWYYYHWRIDAKKFRNWLEYQFHKKYEELIKISKEGEYYFCPRCGPEIYYDFEKAMELYFRCPVCDTPLDLLEEEKILQFKPNIDLSFIKKSRIKKSKKSKSAKKKEQRKVKGKTSKKPSKKRKSRKHR